MTHLWEFKGVDGERTCSECGTVQRMTKTPKGRIERAYRSTPESEWNSVQSPCLGKKYRVERVSHGYVRGFVEERGKTYWTEWNRVQGCDTPITQYDVKWEWRQRRDSFKLLEEPKCPSGYHRGAHENGSCNCEK